MSNVLSIQQFKAKKFDAMLDAVDTPQEQLDREVNASMSRHPASGPKRAKLRVVRDG